MCVCARRKGQRNTERGRNNTHAHTATWSQTWRWLFEEASKLLLIVELKNTARAAVFVWMHGVVAGELAPSRAKELHNAVQIKALWIKVHVTRHDEEIVIDVAAANRQVQVCNGADPASAAGCAVVDDVLPWKAVGCGPPLKVLVLLGILSKEEKKKKKEGGNGGGEQNEIRTTVCLCECVYVSVWVWVCG